MRTMTRARDLGIQFEGVPGHENGITDVPGITVGHCTLIQGESIRTGVTAIHPRGQSDSAACFGGWFSLNGNGEMTGTTWIEESGLLEGPILITNTNGVGVARDASIKWEREHGRDRHWSLPVVAETFDGYLNDINGFHVKPEHVFQALNSAASGPLAEGCVGGGTGMVSYGYKGGIGTASRIVDRHAVGVLVQANHGERRQLRLPGANLPLPLSSSELTDTGSIIIIVATDAPMLPHQCKALSRRASLGLARTGSIASMSSGDIFLAFSTGNRLESFDQGFDVQAVGMSQLSRYYEAVVQATEEAIWNALIAATPMTGFQGHHVEAFPHSLIGPTQT